MQANVDRTRKMACTGVGIVTLLCTLVMAYITYEFQVHPVPTISPDALPFSRYLTLMALGMTVVFFSAERKHEQWGFGAGMLCMIAGAINLLTIAMNLT